MSCDREEPSVPQGPGKGQPRVNQSGVESVDSVDRVNECVKTAKTVNQSVGSTNESVESV